MFIWFFGCFIKLFIKFWYMYLVGFLFGFGFDIVIEIVLLVLVGISVVVGLFWYVILCLFVLFVVGMCLLDIIDGLFMNFVYGWVFFSFVCKIYYNIIVIGLLVVVVLLIGSVELLGLIVN